MANVRLLFVAAALAVLPPEDGWAQANACTIIPQAELQTMLGRSDLGRGKPQEDPGGSTCRFPSRSGPDVTLSVAPGTKAVFDDFKKILNEAGEKLESVTGVGDAAFVWQEGTRIYALAGKNVVAVTFQADGATSPKQKSELITLAKTVIARLK